MAWVALTLLFLGVTVSCSTLCSRKQKSCTYQLWKNNSEPPEMCQVRYFKRNGTECAALSFNYNLNLTHNLGDVRIDAYTSEEAKQTAFNLTFTKIKWSRMVMKFSKMGFENDINNCISYKIWKNVTVPKSSVLAYECPWSNSIYEGNDFSLEYEFEAPIISYHRLIFKIPRFRNFGEQADLRNLDIFSYLDVTDSDYLHLYIQLVPKRYNVTSYLIEVIRERSNISTRLTVQIISAKDAINGQLVFPYPTWNEFGYFYFNVSPLSEICDENKCLKSSTPKIFMGRRKSSLVIGIVGASVIIFALFYAMFFMNRQKNNKDDTPPRILLVYSVSINAHYNVVRTLARLLNDVLHIEVFLDVFDIPQTNHQNPVLWYNQAFRDATHIIYIASPEIPPSKSSHSDNIYRVDGVTMKAIITKIACSTNTKQIIVITFPYSINAVPSELNTVRRFDLVKDIDSFVNSLVMLPYQSWTFLHLYRPNRFRGEPQYMELLEHIQGAQKEFEVLNFSNSTKSSTAQLDVIAQNDRAEDEEKLLTGESNIDHVNLSTTTILKGQ
ncbi:hypothetical protein PPYR_13302 [Photinus pyralis]|uniref:SEFIR domain-containing protein n=1 Tax=Photinus pyralis TaxID=7054 RepID=A0A5N4A8P0_PHOPY|nr:uncharacterized protein LOC116178691 [Photinus pyralis]XP_031354126.1 uncharacterized protein LOC116178691 [Photinus pyralis]XP_031354127.1 uncharacterized protein LOC116178691 [Photinus pyralis]KAB0793682.1 hypothetical protein PPYR_13302 [Photinus pyralis]